MKKFQSLVALGALSFTLVLAGCKGEEAAKPETKPAEPPKVTEEKAPATAAPASTTSASTTTTTTTTATTTSTEGAATASTAAAPAPEKK